MNRQSDNQDTDKPEGKSREHGGVSEQPRPDGPVDHDVPDDAVIEKTLPKIPVGPPDV